jgi:hypothetical protein
MSRFLAMRAPPPWTRFPTAAHRVQEEAWGRGHKRGSKKAKKVVKHLRPECFKAIPLGIVLRPRSLSRGPRIAD